MAKKKDLVQGIFIPRLNKFYYLESGGPNFSTSITRLRRILMQRDILSLADKQKMDHSVMTLKTAEELKYEIEIVFASSHIRKLHEQQSGTKSIWS